MLLATFKLLRRARCCSGQTAQKSPLAGKGGDVNAGTDYAKWDMWCPSDEEDEMINSIPPNTPEFRAMEKDIEERHKR